MAAFRIDTHYRDQVMFGGDDPHAPEETRAASLAKLDLASSTLRRIDGDNVWALLPTLAAAS